jgi:hypothetical protein
VLEVLLGGDHSSIDLQLEVVVPDGPDEAGKVLR